MNLHRWHQNVLVVMVFFMVTCAQVCFLFLKPFSRNVFDEDVKSLFSISKVRVFFFSSDCGKIYLKFTVLTIFKFIVQWHSHC